MRQKKKQPTDHEFSLSSGQMVGLIVGGIVMVLLAFIAGLLVDRYEKTQQFLALERENAERARTAVPLTTAAAPAIERSPLPTVDLSATTSPPAAPKRVTPPKRPLQTAAVKPTSPAKPAPTEEKQVEKEPAKPTPPAKPAKPAPSPTKPTVKKPAEPKPVDAAKKPAPAVPATGKYSVQVFASRSGRVTGNYVKKLGAAGFPAWTRQPNRRAGDVWYRAMIGRFPTRADANGELKKLKQRKEFADAYIVRAG